MMTAGTSEAERAKKGRSASLSVPEQSPLTLGAAHSSTDVPVQSLMKAANGSPAHHNNYSPKSSLKASSSTSQHHSAARRSQSCRVQGSRPPRASRRQNEGTPRGSNAGLDQGSESSRLNSKASLTGGDEVVKSESYNPFLKKVGSCGRLVTLAPEDDQQSDSPILRRSASARRPRPPSSPSHSPTPTRATRPSSSSVKGRTSSRKGPSGNARRVAASTSSGGFLEVRTAGSSDSLDPDACLLRNFSTSNKGIVNRGDSFRRRRSRSNSIQPPYDPAPLPSVAPRVRDIASIPGSPQLSSSSKEHPSEATEHFRVAIVGAPGVGKTALMNQFRTSECINAYDCSSGNDDSEDTVTIVLNSIESEITLVNLITPTELYEEMTKPVVPNGWLIVYSITDKTSFQRSQEDLTKLQNANLLKSRVAIVTGNKCELVRTRAVSFEDGRDMAYSFGAKFMEISVGMNHKCDDLLVGILHQLRLKDDLACAAAAESEDKGHNWSRNKSLMRASMKARKLVNRIIGKSDSKLKQCEDFLV